MKLSLNWLKEYVDIKESPEEMALKLTMHSAEVEEVKPQAELLDNVVVGKIKAIREHPNADKLKLVDTEIDEGVVQIVCGGTNLKEGLLVAVAKPGSKVRWHGEGEPVVLEKAKIRGDVVIEAVTDIYGRVIKATVITGHPLLRHAAREAVLQWVYEPYIVNGIPRPAQFSVVVHFDYKNPKGKEKKGRQSAACLVTPTEIPDETVEEENKAFGIDRGVEGGLVEGVLGGTIGGVNGGPIILGKPASPSQDKVNRTQTVLTGPVGLKSVKVHLPLSGKKYMFLKKMIDKGETYSLTFSFFSIRLKNTLIYLFILLILIIMALIVYKKIKKRV